jgi:hypothetical protein
MHGVCAVSAETDGGRGTAPRAPAPWGSPPTPLLPRWYINRLAELPLPTELRNLTAPHVGGRSRPAVVGDLDSIWTHLATSVTAEILGALVSLVGNLVPPMDLAVLPAGTSQDRLLACPLRTRTRNCLLRAIHQRQLDTDEPTTVGQLVVLPNFGMLSLLDLMCLAEAAQASGFLVHTPTDWQQHREAAGDQLSPAEPPRTPSQWEAAWSDAADSLGKVLGAAADFRGARTLADALRVDLGELAGHLGLDADLDGILVDDLRSESGPADETVAAIGELWEHLTSREQAILGERIIAPEPLSLEQIAARFGVTRERIRQQEKRLQGALRSSGGLAASVTQCVRRVAAVVRSGLAPVIAVDDLEHTVRETFPTPASAGGRDAEAVTRIARDMLRGELAYSCNDDVCLSPEAGILVEDLRIASRELADDIGLLRESELRDRLPEGIWHEHWDVLLRSCDLHRINDHLAIRNTTKARVKAALLAIGRPATKEELAECCGLTPQQAAAQMSAIQGIVRADKARWGLAEWIDDVYEGIPAEIIQRIEEDGGATLLARLLEELPRLFGVKESSVRAYVGTPRFRLRDGHVSLADVSSLALRPLGDVASGHTADGHPYFCFIVEERYFDGYSLAGVPPEIVGALGCEPDGRARVSVSWPPACRPLSVSWPLASIGGPTIGYLADPLRHLDARDGDRIRLVIEDTGLASMHLDSAADAAPMRVADHGAAAPASVTRSSEGDRSRALLDRMKQRRGGN